MKHILLIFIAAIALASCGEPTVFKTDKLPVEVVTIKEAQKFDTLLVIPTTNETYVFNKRGEYQGRYQNTTDGSVGVGVFMTFIIIVCLVVVGLIAAAIGS